VSNLLALDVGERKIGVARANSIARIAEPLVTLPNSQSFASELTKLINEHDASLLIVGLPRGMNGQETAQTQYVRDFMNQLSVPVEYVFQDEALTSVNAEAQLKQSGKAYTKEDIDAVAASIILSDYLQEVVAHGK
jgi:putative Holliday junction resolvase